MAGTPLPPGTVLARRFRLDDLLGEVDGARFWRATDQTLARSVAVHVLPTTDPRSDSLLTAARTSALVSDGHLLRVLDAAEEDGVVYVVNEWGTGVSLDRLLAEGPLSPRRAAWVVKEVAEAIATAHRNGVAHGRLLPENVMISEAGSVKLIGFVIDAVLRSDTGRGQRRVTGGEPMSAHESDVVNLGALLYVALVGRWPGSEGSSIPAAPAEHDRPLRPRRVRAGVPRPLDAICERVLNAEAHPHMVPIETAHEIYAALSDYIGDPGAAVNGDSTGAPAENGEATALLGPDDLPGGRTAAAGAVAAAAEGLLADPDERTVGEPGPDTGAPAASSATAGDETGDLTATGELGTVPAADPHQHPEDPELPDGTAPAEPTRSSEPDPDATQAGTPMFFDDETGGGWLAGSGRSASNGASYSPPPPPPEQPVRPLFADGPAAASAGRAWSDHDPDHDPHADAEAAQEDGSFLGSFGRGSASRAYTDRADRGTASRGRADRGGRTNHPPVPAVWGPDADEPPPAETDGWASDHDEVPGRSWLRLAVVLGLVLVVVLGAMFVLGLGGGRGAGSADPSPTRATSSKAAARSTPVAISAVDDFDPEGDPPEENPDLTGLAVDGKPGTAWQTLTYRGNPKLGGLKSGVGLLVDLGKPTRVGDVKLALLGTGTSLDLLAAPDATSAPTSTDGLDTVASAQDAGTAVDLTIKKPVTTRWLVVWLTSLPPAPGGFKGQVAEIHVRS